MDIARLRDMCVLINRKHRLFRQPSANPYVMYDNQCFRRRFRMSKEAFRVLVDKIGAELDFVDDRNYPSSPEIQVLTALRFYATGIFQLVDGDLMCLSQSTVCRIVSRVSSVLSKKCREFITFPSQEECAKEQEEFFKIAGFPGVIGVIDGTHIEVKVNKNIQERFRNRKNRITLNVQAVVGHNRRFTNIVVRWPGSVHDSRVFRRSSLYTHLSAGGYSGHILGDSAYPLKHYLLTPLGNPTGCAQSRYQRKFIRTRLIIEQTFGSWKRKFNCLHIGLRTKMENTLNIINSCAVLWNFLIQQNEVNIGERNSTFTTLVNYTPPADDIGDDRSLAGIAKRAEIVNYFDF